MNLMGDRVCLRNIEDLDKDFLKELLNDEQISKNVVGWSKPISSTEHNLWFNNLKNDLNEKIRLINTLNIWWRITILIPI